MSRKYKKNRKNQKPNTVIISQRRELTLPEDTSKDTEQKAQCTNIPPQPEKWFQKVYRSVHSREWSVVLINAVLVIFTYRLYSIAVDQADSARIAANAAKEASDIARQTLDMNYRVSVEITYSNQENRLIILNKSHTNIFLWGTQYDSEAPAIEKNYKIITHDGGNYYIDAPKIKHLLEEKQKTNIHEVRFIVYIETENYKKYAIHNLFKLLPDNMVHTQTFEISETQF